MRHGHGAGLVLARLRRLVDADRLAAAAARTFSPPFAQRRVTRLLVAELHELPGHHAVHFLLVVEIPLRQADHLLDRLRRFFREELDVDRTPSPSRSPAWAPRPDPAPASPMPPRASLSLDRASPSRLRASRAAGAVGFVPCANDGAGELTVTTINAITTYFAHTLGEVHDGSPTRFGLAS